MKTVQKVEINWQWCSTSTRWPTYSKSTGIWYGWKCSNIHDQLSQQRLKNQGHNSEWLNLSKGVPQGSISGPTVFNFFDVLALQQTRQRMLRMVLEDYESSYEDLLAKCRMSMLEIQRAKTLAIEVYKSIHQMTPIYIQEMFNIKITESLGIFKDRISKWQPNILNRF